MNPHKVRLGPVRYAPISYNPWRQLVFHQLAAILLIAGDQLN